ncbi:hypothetical protein NQ315_001009 [Exocentrus adspersus]|uniref:Secreted protein n=1 Tax=Exocentrus adspersus TaxID=1586481 RepID=A0AAV8WE87_9CUCU|nr:hypothetical protein NQ315_001009 [Exocentrus adspersus]
MRAFYTLLCLYSSIHVMLAYPVDYNETTIEQAKEALNTLRELVLTNNFPVLLQDYNDDISLRNNKTYKKINTNYDGFSQRLLQVQESGSNVGVNVTDCLNNLNVLTPEEYYVKYTEDCVTPARSVGLNLYLVGNNNQEVVAYKKYGELMDYFHGCINGGDPAPRICAGVIESTLQEVRRVVPGVKANPVLTEIELKQHTLVLAECASKHLSLLRQKLQMEFSKAATCVWNKINTV